MNTFNRTAIFVIGLLVLASCSSTPRLSEIPSDDIDLSGRWVLDREASDNPQDVIQTAMVIAEVERANDRRGSAGGMGGGGKGGGGMRGGGGKGGGGMRGSGSMPPDGSTEPGEMRMTNFGGLFPNADWIEIAQSDELVKVDFGGHRSRSYTLQTPITTVGAAGSMETESGWSGTEFWTVTKSERGMKITERYVVSPNRSELLLETVLDAKAFDDALMIRQVFHPAS